MKTLNLPKIVDDCELYFAQHPNNIPFKIKRVYYILGANTKLSRGYHAHKKNRQVIFCIQGSIKLMLDNGKKREEIILNKPSDGLLLENMVWHEMHDFKKNTILLILASEKFKEQDYIRNYEKFKRKTVNKIS